MKLVLGRQNPTFSVVAVQLRADITYSKATVSVIIDERGLNKYARDYINEADELYFALTKGLITYQDAIDIISQIALFKQVVDDYVVSDLVSVMVGYVRSYAHNVTISDQINSFDIAKRLLETIVSLDALAYSLSKSLSDTVIVIDNADANSGDGLEYTEVKPSSDSADVEDLAVSSMFKPLQDVISLTEMLQQTVQKILADAASAVEQAYLALSKPLTDSLLTVDIVDRVFDAARTYLDSVSQTEVLALDNTKPQTDTYAATDTFNRVFSAYLASADSQGTTDLARFDASKLVSENATAIDLLDRVFSANLTASDSALTLDVLASIDVSKLLTDAANAVSSGSLRMTDYADITYFAEGYVGSTRTFS
jgi:hypothetical protein